jgi:PKD repeat protein
MKKLMLIIMIGFVTGCSKDTTKAAFSFTIQEPEKGFCKEVIFDNTSQNAMIYEWDFGDGNTSTLPSPTHVYDSVGTFTVTLIASSEDGEDEYSKEVTITAPLIIPGQEAFSVNLGASGLGPLFDFIDQNIPDQDIRPNVNGFFNHRVINFAGNILFVTIGIHDGSKWVEQEVSEVLIASTKTGVTAEGIAVGDDFSKVTDMLGTPDNEVSSEVFSPGNNSTQHSYDNGIIFFENDGKVSGILILKT